MIHPLLAAISVASGISDNMSRVAVSRLEMRGWPTSFGQPRRAGLAGFEPATHGPGNRLSSSVILRNADFYAVSALSLLHHITKIDCHKLSNRLSDWLEREKTLLACGGGAQGSARVDAP